METWPSGYGASFRLTGTCFRGSTILVGNRMGSNPIVFILLFLHSSCIHPHPLMKIEYVIDF